MARVRAVTVDEMPAVLPAPVSLRRRKRARAAKKAGVLTARAVGAVLLLLVGFAVMHGALSALDADCCATASAGR